MFQVEQKLDFTTDIDILLYRRPFELTHYQAEVPIKHHLFFFEVCSIILNYSYSLTSWPTLKNQF